MFAESEAGAKKAGSNGVEGKFQDVRDFEIGELFEFPKEQNLAIGGVEPRESLAEPENFVVVSLGAADKMNVGIRTEEKGTKGEFATVGAEDFESDGKEIRAEEGARLVPGRGTKERDESFLGKLFGAGKIGSAAQEKGEDGLAVTEKEFIEGGGIAVREGEHELLVGWGGGLGGVGHRAIGNGVRTCLH
jgi:hypothetical protein